MPLKIPAGSPFQTANYFKKKYKLSPTRLKTAALSGAVRTQSFEHDWQSCLYNVDDVKEFMKKHKVTPRRSSAVRSVASAAGK